MDRRNRLRFCAMLALGASACLAQELPRTLPLTGQADLSAEMVAGIDRFLQHETERALLLREKAWTRDFSSAAAYERSVEPKRDRFRKIIGAVNPRLSVTNSGELAKVAETDSFTVHEARWPVLENVLGEGLLLRPKQTPTGVVLVLPDADQTPEMVVGLASGLVPERQVARRLAENGFAVLVPTLIDRQDTWSGNPKLNRFTNQPHREWIYRQAFELGRHVIGYEVEKVIDALDWLERNGFGNLKSDDTSRIPRYGVFGYAEGGLIAFYAAALDRRISAVVVSGYFDSRQQLSEEPIYRNVFGLLTEFGDAEIATLVAPRSLIVEHSVVPKVDGPPKAREGRRGAAPGRLKTPDYESVEREFERAQNLLKKEASFDHLTLISGTEGMATGPGSDRALLALLNELGPHREQLKPTGATPVDSRQGFDPAARQQRQVKELEDYTQRVFSECEQARDAFFWKPLAAKTPQEWETTKAPFQKRFWDESIGRLPGKPGNVRARRIQPPDSGQAAATNNPARDKTWVLHEVVLDVLPDVAAWGYLLVPNGIKPGEKRPVVVCQHGLEGVPADVINENPATQAYRYYKAFGARLAEEGFVVFAPHNPYRGEDAFRRLQRRANPLGKSLFSIIIAQHEQILVWLGELPFVDSKRIGFYGLSYGGKTAMRVPAVLEGYALSICSGDFNEWVRKNVSVDFPASYMFTGEYEMPEFDLGHTFNYAEMAGLVAPRPFMVERGHNDPVGIDEWVSYEYGKVRTLYDRLGITNRTAIEFFDGPHTIHGVGTFQFLKQHLHWPDNK